MGWQDFCWPLRPVSSLGPRDRNYSSTAHRLLQFFASDILHGKTFTMHFLKRLNENGFIQKLLAGMQKVGIGKLRSFLARVGVSFSTKRRGREHLPRKTKNPGRSHRRRKRHPRGMQLHLEAGNKTLLGTLASVLLMPSLVWGWRSLWWRPHGESSHLLVAEDLLLMYYLSSFQGSLNLSLTPLPFDSSARSLSPPYGSGSIDPPGTPSVLYTVAVCWLYHYFFGNSLKPPRWLLVCTHSSWAQGGWPSGPNR